MTQKILLVITKILGHLINTKSNRISHRNKSGHGRASKNNIRVR